MKCVRPAGVVMKTSGVSTDQVQIVCTFLIMPKANQMQSQSFSLTWTACLLCLCCLWWNLHVEGESQPPATINQIGVPHLTAVQSLHMTVAPLISALLISTLTHDKNRHFRDGRGPAPIFRLFCSCCPEFVIWARAPPMIACLYREVTSRPADVTLFWASLCADGLKQLGCGGDEEEPQYFPQWLP